MKNFVAELTKNYNMGRGGQAIVHLIILSISAFNLRLLCFSLSRVDRALNNFSYFGKVVKTACIFLIQVNITTA